MVRAALRAADFAEALQRDESKACLITWLIKSMADGTHDGGKRDNHPDHEADLSARLQSLGDRLKQTSQAPETTDSTRSVSDPTAMARGFRMSTELVAGVLVGTTIGWLLDRALGISPWGMIVFLLLGFAAGVLNVMRSAGVVRENRIDSD